MLATICLFKFAEHIPSWPSNIVHRRYSVRKGIFRNFSTFTGKHLCQSPFSNNVRPQPATLLKKGLWHRCFPVNSAKFLGIAFLQNTSGWLLLQIHVTLCSTYLLNDKNHNTCFLTICFYKLCLVRLFYFCRFPDFKLQRTKVRSRNNTPKYAWQLSCRGSRRVRFRSRHNKVY